MAGGKTSTSTTNSPYASILAQIGQQAWKIAKPVYQQTAAESGEALRTGGVNAQIPSVNRALDASRESYSQSYQDMANQLAESGLANSSYGQSILARMKQEEGQQIANEPSAIASQFISMAPGVTNEGNAGMNALANAGSLDRTSTSTPSFWDYFMKGLGGVSQGAGAGIGTYAALAG